MLPFLVDMFLLKPPISYVLLEQVILVLVSLCSNLLFFTELALSESLPFLGPFGYTVVISNILTQDILTRDQLASFPDLSYFYLPAICIHNTQEWKTGEKLKRLLLPLNIGNTNKARDS